MTRAAHPAAPAQGADYRFAPLGDDLEWQGQGICRSHPNPDLWNPDGPKVESKCGEAVRLCETCPVILACREWALTRHEIFGVWGGLSPADREAIWKGRVPRRRHLQRRRRRRIAA